MTLPGFFQGTGMPDAGWWEALWPNPAKVLADVGLEAGMSAVDLCCGDGWFPLSMVKIARHVIGIDIDAGLLETARTRLTETGVTNCTFVEADAFEIGRVLRAPADHVFLANVFHGVPRRIGACTCRARRSQAGRSVGDRQLARKAARRNGNPGRAERTSDGITDGARADHCICRAKWPRVAQPDKGVTLSLRRCF